MKYTLDGFSQEIAINLNLDSVDLRLLRYFIDFKDSGAMAKEVINDDIYYWVKYDAVVENLPILNITKKTIMTRLKKLAEKDILKSYTKKKGGTFSFYAVGKNYAALIDSSKRVLVETDKGSSSNGQGVSVETDTVVSQNGQQKTPLLKDTSIINKDIYSKVIDYLNKKTNSNYKATTKTNLNLIKARVTDGFELKDFIKVIDVKFAEWNNTNMEQYLRPQTLFGSKFESYLNQRGVNNGFNKQNDSTNKNNSKYELKDFN